MTKHEELLNELIWSLINQPDQWYFGSQTAENDTWGIKLHIVNGWYYVKITYPTEINFKLMERSKLWNAILEGKAAYLLYLKNKKEEGIIEILRKEPAKTTGGLQEKHYEVKVSDLDKSPTAAMNGKRSRDKTCPECGKPFYDNSKTNTMKWCTPECKELAQAKLKGVISEVEKIQHERETQPYEFAK